MRLYYKKLEVTGTIQNMDVMSLYPYVCKYFKFPVRHPLIHVGDACQDKEDKLPLAGLINCSVEPPQRLYNPLFSFRYNGKLLFCLYMLCAIERNVGGECAKETVAQRALTGTIVDDEVILAVQKG